MKLSRNKLRKIIRIILSEGETSNVLTLRSPGSDHYGYGASHPKKIKARRPSLGHEESPSEPEETLGPVIVSRAFGKRDS